MSIVRNAAYSCLAALTFAALAACGQGAPDGSEALEMLDTESLAVGVAPKCLCKRLVEYAEDEGLTSCSSGTGTKSYSEGPPLTESTIEPLARAADDPANIFTSTIACDDADMTTKPRGGIRYPSEVSDSIGQKPKYKVNQTKKANTCGTVSDATASCISDWYSTAGDPHKFANWAAGCVGGKVAILIAKEVNQLGKKCTGTTKVKCKVQVQGHPTLAAWFHDDADRAAAPKDKEKKLTEGDQAMDAEKDTAVGAGEILLVDGKPCWNADSGRYGAAVVDGIATKIAKAFNQLPRGTAPADGIPKC